jgi:hypothetical protein
MIPGVALASSATDAALGLGAFAVFNQIISGTGLFGGLGARPVVVAPPPVYAEPPAPVYVAPPPPPVLVAPRPVYFAPPPVFVRPAPVYAYPAPVRVFHRAHGPRWHHGWDRGWGHGR